MATGKKNFQVDSKKKLKDIYKKRGKNKVKRNETNKQEKKDDQNNHHYYISED